MKLSALLEVSGKVIAVVCILLFVRTADDSWKVLAFQAIAPAITTAVGLWMAFKTIPRVAPRFALFYEAFGYGWPMFLFRSGESLYGVGNAFVLGLFAPAAFVGYFAGADKITRAVFGLLLPIREVLFPRLSNLAGRSRAKAERLARSGVILMITGGLALGAIQWISAPFLIHLLMGPGFAPAVTVLRIEAVFPVLLSITYSVGLQWLIPLGKDRIVTWVIGAAGLLNLCLATFLAPRLAHVGMAWSVVLSETFVCVSFSIIVSRTQPFWGKRRVPVPEIPELLKQ